MESRGLKILTMEKKLRDFNYFGAYISVGKVVKNLVFITELARTLISDPIVILSNIIESFYHGCMLKNNAYFFLFLKGHPQVV